MSAPMRIAPVKSRQDDGDRLEVIAGEFTKPPGMLLRKGLIGGRGADVHMLQGNGDEEPPRKKTGRGKKKQIEDSQPDPVKGYFSRLIKLIPAEVVGLYLAGIGVIPKDALKPMWVWAVFCLIMVFLSRSYTTSDKKQGIPVEWPAVFIAAGSYCIWVYVSPGPLVAYNSAQPYIGSLLILGWTAVVPKLYNPK